MLGVGKDVYPSREKVDHTRVLVCQSSMQLSSHVTIYSQLLSFRGLESTYIGDASVELQEDVIRNSPPDSSYAIRGIQVKTTVSATTSKENRW